MIRRLSGFILCAILLSILSHSDAQSACWVLTSDTNFFYGVVNNATNVSQCQAACQAQALSNCIAVDWDNTKPNGSKCFLNSIAQNKNRSPGVDHYDFVCTNSSSTTGSTASSVSGITTGSPATGSTISSTVSSTSSGASPASNSSCWVLTSDTNFFYGVVNNATNVSQCQAACQAQALSNCIAVDWDNTKPNGSKCFLNSIAQNKNRSPGVDHYDFVCTNSSSTTGSTASSVSGITTGFFSTGSTISSTVSSNIACWVQMNDTLIDQGVGNNATGIPQCQAICQAQTSPSKCLSVDWDNTKLSGIKCFLHSTSQGKRPAPGVDHYDFIC